MVATIFLGGLDPKTGEYVHPSEVPSGKACGCICPSCKTPFIARKGPINRWHFAHDPAEYGKTQRECDYSLFTSIRLMVLQILSQATMINLPIYEKAIPGSYSSGTPYTYVVSEAKTLLIPKMILGYKVGEATVDACIDFGNFKLIIQLVHPDRPFPHDLMLLQDEVHGVVWINVSWAAASIDADEFDTKTYKDMLRFQLLENAEDLHWAYHPRQKKLAIEHQNRVSVLAATSSNSKRGKAAMREHGRRKRREAISDRQIEDAIQDIKKNTT